MSPPFNELARVQEFISFAHKLGVGFEAAFIISLNVRGSELFKYARDNLVCLKIIQKLRLKINAFLVKEIP